MIRVWLHMALGFVLGINLVHAQVFVTTEGSHVSINNTNVALNDLHMINNGKLKQSEGQFVVRNKERRVYFEGKNMPELHSMQLDIEGRLVLNTSILVVAELEMVKGEIDLGRHELILPFNESKIVGETSNRRIHSTGGGEIVKLIASKPLEDENVGNLGLVFSKFNLEDTMIIRRGHSSTPLPFGESITRYYKVSTRKKPSDKLELGLEYFEDEVLLRDPKLKEHIWFQNNGSWKNTTAYSRWGLNNGGVIVKGALEVFETIITVGLYKQLLDMSAIPTAFTPNNDGFNDQFIIPGIEKLPNAEVRIYNQWGQLLYSTNNYDRYPWNGILNDKVLPIDKYFYQISDPNNPLEFVQGEISIIK